MSTESNQQEPRESEMLDVIATLNVTGPEQVPATVEALKQAGLQVVRVDDQNGVVEGVVDATKFGAIRSAPGVEYVRTRFAYIREQPSSVQNLDRGEEPFKVSRAEIQRRALKP